MKIFTSKIKWWLIKHIVIPKLITDDQLTPLQIQIFKLYFDLDEKDLCNNLGQRKLVTYIY